MTRRCDGPLPSTAAHHPIIANIAELDTAADGSDALADGKIEET